MINADKARNITKQNAKPEVPVSAYIEERIDSAISAGYSSVKAWIKKTNLTAADELLKEHGFSYEVVQEEPQSVQLNITW